jgi:prepilin-type N-terminal cleavage/methylation domain-containing protein
VGFTLLELSAVIAIIAIITAGTFSMGSSMVESARKVNTNNKLDAIEEALLAFRLANNRLPCPGDATLTDTPANATTYGYEAANQGTCTGGSPAANSSYTVSGSTSAPAGTTVAEGAVPVKALNLPDEFQWDGWDRKFAYAVWTPLTATNAFITYGVNPNCGAITVENAGHGYRTAAGAYALISYGPDGHGGYLKSGTSRMNSGSDNADELTNCHCTSNLVGNPAYAATYVEQDVTQANPNDPLSVFDDIVRFKDRWQLQNAYDTYVPNGVPCRPGFRIDGTIANGIDGKPISIGDINGDGIPDLIIGTNNFGYVYVVFGTKNGFPDPLPLNTLNGSNGFVIYGNIYPFHTIGESIAVGDVNGDGIPDLILGSADYSAIAVIFGNNKGGFAPYGFSTPLVPDGTFLNGTNGFMITGEATNDYAGSNVAVGDVNGDGIADILISAPSHSPDARVYAVFGQKCGGVSSGFAACANSYSSPLSLSYLNGTNGVRYTDMAKTLNSYSLAAGDVNKDGFADILIGSTTAKSNKGSLYLVFGGNPLMPVTTVTTTSGSTCATAASATGLIAGQYMTSTNIASTTTISAVGSACNNGGGSCSGAPCVTLSAAATGTGAGQTLTVFSTPVNSTFLNGTSGAEYDGTTSTSLQNFPTNITVADINGDGIGDIVTGTYTTGGNGGGIYVIYGRTSGWPSSAQQLTVGTSNYINGTNGFEFDASSNPYWAGSPVAVGDVNNDGIQDIIFGSQQGLNNTWNGVALVVFGHSSAWPYYNSLGSSYFNGATGVEFDGPAANDQTGGTALAVGDINGDGIPDIAIGSPNESPGGVSSAGSVYVYFGKKTGWPTSAYNLGGL